MGYIPLSEAANVGHPPDDASRSMRCIPFSDATDRDKDVYRSVIHIPLSDATGRDEGVACNIRHRRMGGR